MSEGAHIVALGARTPVGLTAASSAAAIRGGISRVREHPLIVDACGEKLRCAYDRLLDPATPSAARMGALASHALRDVAAQLTAYRPLPSKRLPVFLAVPETRPGFGPAELQTVVDALEENRLPNVGRVAVEVVGEGHAGALHALMHAVRQLSEGRDQICVVGGVDSYFDADTLDWLDGDLRVARGEVRSGFPPGEGATMLAVASNSARLPLGLPSLARVRRVACSRERRSRASDEGLLGEALTDAIRQAAASLRVPDERIHDVYCDINGERDRTDDWGFALLRTSALFRDGTEYTMSVSQCGDMGAAMAGLNCVLATQAWQRGYASGTRALVWGASWGGLRGAAVLERGAN